MSSVGNDEQLLQAVFHQNFDVVMAAIEAGASVEGPPEAQCTPIAAATVVNNVAMVEHFLGQGADPDRPVTIDRPCPSSSTAAVPGERPLHIAAKTGYVEIVRLLLKGSGADPNATDSEGCTPLMAMCKKPDVCVDAVRLLLEAGADPARAQEKGIIPLHVVAANGNMDLVDILYHRAPDTLNRCASNGTTPLVFACSEGHESTVSKLLSLGARQRVPSDEQDACPLAAAVEKGFAAVVRVLINEGGIKVIGGETALRTALCIAVRHHRARILQLLLMANGAEGRSELANINIGGKNLLHHGAGCCYPAAVSILLEAGADAAARDSGGLMPRDVIGSCLCWEVQIERGKEAAVSRMLPRGPAYRARSWAWPSDEAVEACGGGDGDAAAATAAGSAAALLSPPPAVNPPPVAGMRIFRPNENGGSTCFVNLIGRYCAKD